jgi:hypothetical protein
MANKLQSEMKKAEIFAIRSQAWCLLLEKMFPFFRWLCVMFLIYWLDHPDLEAVLKFASSL